MDYKGDCTNDIKVIMEESQIVYENLVNGLLKSDYEIIECGCHPIIKYSQDVTYPDRPLRQYTELAWWAILGK